MIFIKGWKEPAADHMHVVQSDLDWLPGIRPSITKVGCDDNNINQLSWNESEYSGVDSVVVQPRNLWIPDILLYNSADERFDGTFQTNIVASSEGAMLYVPPGIFKSTCKIDITWFPFGECLMVSLSFIKILWKLSQMTSIVT